MLMDITVALTAVVAAGDVTDSTLSLRHYDVTPLRTHRQTGRLRWQHILRRSLRSRGGDNKLLGDDFYHSLITYYHTCEVWLCEITLRVVCEWSGVSSQRNECNRA